MFKTNLIIATLLLSSTGYSQVHRSLQVTCNKAEIHASLKVVDKTENNYYKDRRTTGQVLFASEGNLIWPTAQGQTAFRIDRIDSASSFAISGQYFDQGNGYSEGGLINFTVERKNGGPIVFGTTGNYENMISQLPRPAGVFEARDCKVTAL